MKTRNLHTDKYIIYGLKKKDNSTIEYVYKAWFPSIESLVLRNSGDNMDAEDMFQDALVILYKKIVYDNLTLTCSLKTFLYAICKNLWFQRLQKKEKVSKVKMEIESDQYFETNTYEMENAKYNLYRKHFLNLSNDCRKILVLFLQKVSLKNIAKIMHHSSPDYTKTRKYLCKKELKKRIFNDPEYKKFNRK